LKVGKEKNEIIMKGVRKNMAEYGDFCKFNEEEEGVFSFLCEDEWKKLSRFFEQKTVAAGEKLWSENDPCDFSAIIVSGSMGIKKETKFKKYGIAVGRYTRGAIVGELCLLDESSRAVSAIAYEDVSLLLITKENFDNLIAEYPVQGAQLLKGMLFSVSKRLKGCYDRLVAVF
jgi:CRP-like cAMP-binding protein